MEARRVGRRRKPGLQSRRDGSTSSATGSSASSAASRCSSTSRYLRSASPLQLRLRHFDIRVLRRAASTSSVGAGHDYVAERQIEFRTELPLASTGKVLRRVLAVEERAKEAKNAR